MESSDDPIVQAYVSPRPGTKASNGMLEFSALYGLYDYLLAALDGDAPIPHRVAIERRCLDSRTEALLQQLMGNEGLRGVHFVVVDE